MARRVLVQLPMSHYNERARWALDYAQVQYEKVNVMPFLHMPVVLYYQKKVCQFAHILSRTRH
jgi:glutathione S-transferase